VAKLPTKNGMPNAFVAKDQNKNLHERSFPSQNFNHNRFASILADKDHL
jgi:hypothetical protein